MTISCGTLLIGISALDDKLTRQVYIQILQIINMKSDKRRKIFISEMNLKIIFRAKIFFN